MPSARRRERAAGAFLIATLFVAAAFLPAQRPLPIDLCLFHRLTGLPCLTCGLTRSVCLLMQGHWLASMKMHPAGGLVLTALGVAAIVMGGEAALGRSLDGRLPRRLIVVLLAAGGVVSLLNWSVGPFGP
jgi:hypothetical protein